MNGASRFVSVGNSFNKDARPKGDIAAGEDAGAVVIRFSSILRIPARHLHSFIACQEREVGLLADCQDHAVAGNNLLFIAECRIEASVSSKTVRQRRTLRPVTTPFSPTISFGPNRCPPQCLRALLRPPRPSMRASERGFKTDHIHFFGARAHGHSRRVKGWLQALGIVILFGEIHLLMHQAHSSARHIDCHIPAPTTTTRLPARSRNQD